MFNSAKWICHPEDGENHRLVPIFRRSFGVMPGLNSATLHITAHGLYEAEINGQAVTEHKFTPGFTSYYHRIQVQSYDVTPLLQIGSNLLQATVGDGWWRWNNNFGYTLALWCKLVLSYDDGTEEICSVESFEVGTGPVVSTDL